MTNRFFVLAVSTWMMACAGSEGTSSDRGDAAALETSSPTDSALGETAADGSIDMAETSVSPDAAATDADTDSSEASVSSCPGFDVIGDIKDWNMQWPFGFAGFLWLPTGGNLYRAPLTPGGPIEAVPDHSGYVDVHPHGSKLMGLDGFEVFELDPSTLASTSSMSTAGSFSNYFPRSTLVGDQLYVLRDVGLPATGSELGYYTPPSTTWTSVWSGPKVDGLARAGDRFFMNTSKDVVTVGSPPVDTTGYERAQLVATDANDAYLYLQTSSSDFDTYRVASGSATKTALGLHLPSAQYASDGKRLVAIPWNESKPVEVHVLAAGGTWKTISCAGSSVEAVQRVAIVGDHAYAAFSSPVTFNMRILRIALP